MQAITVGKNDAGQKLHKLLAKYLNQAPKSFIYKMMRKKNITLNGKKCDGTELLSEGDEIKLFFSDETLAKFSQVEIQKVKKVNLDILYEDEHILLVNKPAGMLSQKAKEDDESLVEYVIDNLLDSGALTKEELRSFRPSVCNRLDRNTSGIVVCGRSLPGLQIMAEVFKDRSLHKYYQCVAAGQVREKIGPDKILGVSAQTVEQALKAQAAGADYLGVGAVFPTGTKDDADAVSYDTLRAICEAVDIPVVAIGGIGAHNVQALAGSGICGIAVVSAIYGQPDIQQAARTLRAKTEEMISQ